EIVTRYEPEVADVYEQLAKLFGERHADTLFSTDGSTVDEQVSALLRGGVGSRGGGDGDGDGDGALRRVAAAESGTGGLLAGRLTDVPGCSAYVLGGVVAYSNDAKVSQVGVEAKLIEQHGAVSQQVAEALATGIRARLGADIGVGVTGIAGPGG